MELVCVLPSSQKNSVNSRYFSWFSPIISPNFSRKNVRNLGVFSRTFSRNFTQKWRNFLKRKNLISKGSNFELLRFMRSKFSIFENFPWRKKIFLEKPKNFEEFRTISKFLEFSSLHKKLFFWTNRFFWIMFWNFFFSFAELFW